MDEWIKSFNNRKYNKHNIHIYKAIIFPLFKNIFSDM